MASGAKAQSAASGSETCTYRQTACIVNLVSRQGACGIPHIRVLGSKKPPLHQQPLSLSRHWQHCVVPYHSLTVSSSLVLKLPGRESTVGKQLLKGPEETPRQMSTRLPRQAERVTRECKMQVSQHSSPGYLCAAWLWPRALRTIRLSS